MTWQKRVFDLFWVLLLAVPLVPIGACLAVVLLATQGRPVFYLSERMQSPSKAFYLVKFRTMTPAVEDSGVSGADKRDRITAIGGVLRRARLDELPQLWNIFRGHISFVGPRPPLRQYVEQFPTLYAQVLRSRPGVTGLATLVFKDHEARLLSQCTTRAETDFVYAHRCVPRKARLDLMYQSEPTLCWDLLLMGATLFSRLPKKLRFS